MRRHATYIRLKVPSDLSEPDRQFLYRLRKNHGEAIRRRPNQLTYDLHNNTRGIYFAKKCKERFLACSIQAVYTMELDDLPEEVVELGKFSENVDAKLKSDM